MIIAKQELRFWSSIFLMYSSSAKKFETVIETCHSWSSPFFCWTDEFHAMRKSERKNAPRLLSRIWQKKRSIRCVPVIYVGKFTNYICHNRYKLNEPNYLFKLKITRFLSFEHANVAWAN